MLTQAADEVPVRLFILHHQLARGVVVDEIPGGEVGYPEALELAANDVGDAHADEDLLRAEQSEAPEPRHDAKRQHTPLPTRAVLVTRPGDEAVDAPQDAAVLAVERELRARADDLVGTSDGLVFPSAGELHLERVELALGLSTTQSQRREVLGLEVVAGQLDGVNEVAHGLSSLRWTTLCGRRSRAEGDGATTSCRRAGR